MARFEAIAREHVQMLLLAGCLAFALAIPAKAGNDGRGPHALLEDPRALVAETSALFSLAASTPPQSGTFLLNQVKQMRAQLDPRDLELLGSYLARPAESEVVWTADHFIFHHASGSEEQPGPVPEAGVLLTAAAMCEQAWSIYHGDQDWPTPRADEGRGGDARVDIYIRDLGEGIYGYALHEECAQGEGHSGFIAINARLFDAPTRVQLDALLSTLAHEYHHLIQFQYGYDSEASWFMEQLATLEEAIVSENCPGLESALTAYAAHPYRCLTLCNGAYEYGTWLWPKFLVEQEGFGWTLVRTAWRLWQEQRIPMIDALDLALQEAGSSLDSAYQEWCFWNAQLAAGGGHPYGGDWRPALALARERVVQQYPALGIHPEILRQPEPLGASFIECRPQAGSADNVLEVTLEACQSLVGATLVVWERPASDPRRIPLTFEDGLYTAKVSRWAEMYRAILIIANGAQAAYACDYSLVLQTRYSASVDDEEEWLAALMLRNRPNPFEPFTVVSFNLPEPMAVTLRIHDAQGRVINTLLEGASSAGQHALYWNGTLRGGARAPAGVYYARLETKVGSRQIRMICVR